jgi:hypothetical protein
VVGWGGCGVWWGGVCDGVWCAVGDGVSLLRSNIPRSALCATLDTYNFHNLMILITNWHLYLFAK